MGLGAECQHLHRCRHLMCLFEVRHPVVLIYYYYYYYDVNNQSTQQNITFRCDIPVVFYKLNTKYNYQSKHNKNYCIMFYNMFYNYRAETCSCKTYFKT